MFIKRKNKMRFFSNLKEGDIIYKVIYDNCGKICDISEERINSIEENEENTVYCVGNKTFYIPKDEPWHETFILADIEYFCNKERIKKEIELEQYAMNFHYEWLKEKLK